VGYARNLLAIAACLLWAVLALDASASEIPSKTVRCENIDQTYLYFAPDFAPETPAHPDRNANVPVVLLLHGAGDQPLNMINAWKHFAAKHKLILLAPALPREEKYEASAPQVFRCVVEDARQSLPIDPQRIYIFGNSMGGYLAYDAAMFESQYFAAVAVHAMRIAEEYSGIIAKAQRKTPIAIYIGDHDQYFSLDSVRQTRDLLRKASFPIHYVELDRHDHNYYARSDDINSDAWKFFRQNPLPVPQK